MVTIKLVRHGESEANIGKVTSQEIGDHEICLSDLGHAQARDAGRTIGREYLSGGLVYASPYRRTRQTLEDLLDGASEGGEDLRADLRIYEDPRLREVEHGYDPVPPQEDLRKRHGWFYYRFRGGESPADCYDRTSSFLESMMRQAERRPTERILIVTHGLLIRCFVMRFLHLSVEEFDMLANPSNGAIVTLADRTTLPDCQFSSGKWGVSGLVNREP
ncbi:MAG TPA: histidine phosphatase family protein [Labilithrix sp.]|nr:histidine phosphatase family protein [Labilithrix sp.]